MSTRPDLPKVKSDEQPSIFNQEAGKWGFLASIGTLAVTMPLVGSAVKKIKAAHFPKTPFHELNASQLLKINSEVAPVAAKIFLFSAAAEFVGAALGGMAGKKQQEQELKQGHVVTTPGYWNKGIMTGLFLAGAVTLPFRYARLSAKNLTNTTGTKLEMALGLAAPVIGSIIRKNSLQRDYDAANALHNQEMTELRQAAAGYKNSVTPEESATLNEKQKPATSHAEQVTKPEQASSGPALS